jgi:hypothetical protein
MPQVNVDHDVFINIYNQANDSPAKYASIFQHVQAKILMGMSQPQQQEQ